MKNRNKINVIMFFAVAVLGVTAFANSVFALANPAAVYCRDLGYDSKVEEGPGGQYGICILPDGSEVDEWQFYKGKTGGKYSYCAQKGYELKVISGEGCPFGGECVVCVLKNGVEVEMKKLIKQETEAAALEAAKTIEPKEKIPSREKINYVPYFVALFLIIILGVVTFIIYKKRKAKSDNDISYRDEMR